MTEHDTNTLWISGWMWGKYPEQATGYRLPQNETEAGEWLEGFRWGTTEACQYHQLGCFCPKARIGLFQFPDLRVGCRSEVAVHAGL